MSIRKDETRERILDSARKLLVERGYFGVGLDEVATAAGLSRQAIYRHHFRSKAELMLALVSHVDEVEGIRNLVAPVIAAPDAVTALAEMVAALATVDERIHDISSLLAGARVADAAAESAWQDRMKRRRAGAEMVVRRLRREGSLAAHWTPREATDYLFTALSSATYQSLVRERHWSKDRYVLHLRFVVHAALVKPGGARA